MRVGGRDGGREGGRKGEWKVRDREKGGKERREAERLERGRGGRMSNGGVSRPRN